MNKEKGLNIGFVGVGQCGGNIANAFSKLGYLAIAINTSQTDVRLSHIKDNNCLVINSKTNGAGKNPEIGRLALEDHIDEVVHLTKQVFSNTDMIYVCAGLGGGTGSGMASLISEVLMDMGFDVGLIITIPSKMECPKAKIVALNAFEEISSIEDIKSVFVIDNSKTSNLPSQMGIKTKYNILNDNMAMKFDYFNASCILPSDPSFDPRDLKTLLETRGSAIISSINIDDIANLKDVAYLAQMGHKALKDSIFADSDTQAAKGCAFLIELPTGGNNYLTEDALYQLQEEFGTPFETFVGLYEKKDRTKEVSLSILLTGLPFPFDQFNKLQSQVEEKADKIQSQFDTSMNQKFSGNGKALMNKFMNTPKQTAPKPSSESTLSKLLKKKNGQ